MSGLDLLISRWGQGWRGGRGGGGVKGEKHLLWVAYVCPFRLIRRDTVEARGREWGGVEMVTTVAPPPRQVCRRDWR